MHDIRWARSDPASARSDRRARRRAFRGAARIYQDLGAEWGLRRAARLRRYGINRGRGGRRPRAAQGWEALTPPEAKIVSLVAAGRSNPDIAAELFLSRNTVQTHVSHILAKLGARSRAEIIRQVVEQAGGAETVGLWGPLAARVRRGRNGLGRVRAGGAGSNAPGAGWRSSSGQAWRRYHASSSNAAVRPIGHGRGTLGVKP